jgi:hypothetical protein
MYRTGNSMMQELRRILYRFKKKNAVVQHVTDLFLETGNTSPNLLLL